MTDKLHIGIDIDDVVSNTLSRMLNFYNRAYRKNIPFHEITSWDLTNHLPGMDREEQVRELIKGFTYTHSFRTVTPVDGAIEGITRWRQQGHKLSFVSARNSSAISDTYKWFEEHGLPVERVYFDRDKGWHSRYHDFDVFVDDGIHNLVNIRAANPNTRTVLFDRPWNQDIGGEAHAVDYRAKDWETLDRYVSGIARGKTLTRDNYLPWLEWRLPKVYRDE